MAWRMKQFLQDHKLEETVDEGGKVRRRYVYRGDRYERRLTPGQRRAERYVGVLTALIAGGLGVFAAVQDTPANTSGFFAALSVLTLVPALGALAGAVIAFFRKGDLTVGEYRERRVLLTLMPLLGAAFLLLLTVGYALQGAFPALAAALLSAILYALIGIHERRVKYTVHPGHQPS